jgi:hypothetical protein
LSVFKIRRQLIIGPAIYLGLLSLIFLEVSYLFGLGIICISFLGLAKQSAKKIILLPFYLFPFIFLIRAQSPDNLILSILPDLTVVLAIVYNLFFFKLNKKDSTLFGLIILLSVLTFFINLIHVGEFRYFAIIFRQYVLPLAFLMVFINSTKIHSDLPEEALFISILSFSLVATLSLMNITGIIFIPRSMEALYPFLNYVENTDNIKQISRSIGDFSFPRLNIFTGGALGSSAALFFILGLIAFFKLESKRSWVPKILAIPLLLASLACLSVSILTAVVGFVIAFYFLRKASMFNLSGGILGMVGVVYLLINGSIMGISPAEYFIESSLSEFIKFVSKLNFLELMFGVGPRLTSTGFEFIPENFIIDVGVFRVFVESGAIVFLVFIAILLIVLYRGFSVSYYYDEPSVRPYVAIFLVFIGLVHANMTALPPFYPLFCAACSGMLYPRADRSKM